MSSSSGYGLEDIKTKLNGKWPKEPDVDEMKHGILIIQHVYDANVTEVATFLLS